MFAYKEKTKENRTGIPAAMSERLEKSTGVSFEDVKVHYNSEKPEALGALAYTQGNQIFVGPGQERYLAHELGHVAQQKMGLVREGSMGKNGAKINTEERFERQADELAEGKNLSLTQGMGVKEGNVIQRKESNPFHKSPGEAGGMPLTAHHIIPESLLKEVYGLLTMKHKNKIDKSSGASRVYLKQELGEREQEEEKWNYISWPQGNLFYGPNTLIRAEAGDKDDFDYDARFIMEKESFLAAKECYDVISTAKEKNSLSPNEEKKVFEALNKYYKLTAFEPLIGGLSSARIQKQPIAYKQEDWEEISTWEEVELISKYRENLKDYLYIKLPVPTENMESVIGFEKICRVENSRYQYKKEDGKICNFNAVKEIDGNAIIKYKKNSELMVYLQKQDAEYTTFLPRKLVDFIYFLEDEDINNIPQKMEDSTDMMKPEIEEMLNNIKKVITTKDRLIPWYDRVVGDCNRFLMRYERTGNFKTIALNFQNMKIDNTVFEKQANTVLIKINQMKKMLAEIEEYHKKLENMIIETQGFINMIIIKENNEKEKISKRKNVITEKEKITQNIKRLKSINRRFGKGIEENRRIRDVRCYNGKISELLNDSCQKLQQYI